MFEHLSGDDPALGIGSKRKRDLKILDRQAPMATIDGVERATQERTRTENGAHRQHADDADHRFDRGVLETVPKWWTRFSQ